MLISASGLCGVEPQAPLLLVDIVEFKQRRAGSAARGAAHLDGRILRGTGDGRLIALDAKTGKTVWEVQGADPAQRESFGAAPIAWQGKVFIGTAISERGIQGRLMAFDAKTGQELWRFVTAPGADQGGGFWTSFSLDPVTGEVFGPVANPSPDYSPESRPGLNLYTNSVISLNATTGEELARPGGSSRRPRLGPRHPADALSHSERKEHAGHRRQERPRVRHRPGEPGPRLRHAGHDVAQRHPPGGSDSETRVPRPHRRGAIQRHGLPPGPRNPLHRHGDWCFYFQQSATVSSDPADEGLGGFTYPDFSMRAEARPGRAAPPSGQITAMDGETGRVLWTYRAEAQVQAGVMPTKSGLLFAGDV